MFKFLMICLLSILSFSASARISEDPNRPTVCDMPLGPRLERCHAWVDTVKRPDVPASCCGEGDAFITDNFELIDGYLYATITADYPNNSVIKKGMKILIPQNKVNFLPEDANRSPHGVVFLLPSGNRDVLCFFFPPLT